MVVEDTTTAAARRRPGSQREASWWLVAGPSPAGVFTMNGLKTLPVFSFLEEAEMFLWFEPGGEGLRLRELESDELLQVLAGPCAEAERVALDPLPRRFADDMIDLVSLSRRRFEILLLDKVRNNTPAAARSLPA